MLVPVKTVFAAARFAAVALVIHVHIYKTIPLAHFACGGGDQINRAPGCIAQQLNAILVYGLFHRLNMPAHIINAVVVMYAAIGFHCILCTQAVFNNEQRLLIAVVEVVQHDTQPQRVNLPAPFAGFKMRIAESFGGIGGLHSAYLFGVRCNAATGVVAEADKIYCALGQRCLILRLHMRHYAQLFHLLQRIWRIIAARLHVTEKVIYMVLPNRCPHVLRVTAPGVIGTSGQHTAKLCAGHKLMPKPDGFCACYQLVMRHLIFCLCQVFAFRDNKARAAKRQMHKHIYLIEGKPVFYLTAIPAEHSFTVTLKGVNGFAAAPAAVFFHQRHWQVKVAKCDKWFHTIAAHGVNKFFVKAQPGLVRFRILSGREDTRPANGKPQALKAHLRKELQILPPVAVKINGFMAWEIGIGINGAVVLFTAQYSQPIRPPGDHIYNAWPTPVRVPASLTLVSSNSATPQKVFRHLHITYTLLFTLFCYYIVKHKSRTPAMPTSGNSLFAKMPW